jgi:hypothetical protein
VLVCTGHEAAAAKLLAAPLPTDNGDFFEMNVSAVGKRWRLLFAQKKNKELSIRDRHRPFTSGVIPFDIRSKTAPAFLTGMKEKYKDAGGIVWKWIPPFSGAEAVQELDV